MVYDLPELTDRQAVLLLRAVARRWVEERGIEAFVVNQHFIAAVEAKNLKIPPWAVSARATTDKDLVVASRAALWAIASGEDVIVASWVESELKRLKETKAEVLDPISLAILGATLIGCILAARVRKIGSTEFYKGVPKELADVVKSATPAINVKVGKSTD